MKGVREAGSKENNTKIKLRDDDREKNNRDGNVLMIGYDPSGTKVHF